MSRDNMILVSSSLSAIHTGVGSLATTMECLAESRSVAMGGGGVGSDVLDTLSVVTRSLLDKLEDVMDIFDHDAEKTE